MTAKPTVKEFFDAESWTLSYVVADSRTGRAAVIDSVLDYDPKSGRIGTASADAVVDYVRTQGLTVDWLLETHAHADHFSAAAYLKETIGGRSAIGENIRTVQLAFQPIFNMEKSFAPDGRQFDHLFRDGDVFRIGDLQGSVLHTPGHTPACITYVIGDAAFIGDTLFMPDYGTARCDFPGGDPRMLYRSIQRLFALPPDTRLFMCHDYKPGGRDLCFETTVAEQRANNVHIRDGVSEDDFVRMRTARDATLAMPALMLPAVQVNIRAGRLPPPEDNQVSYLKIPVNLF